MSKRYDIVNGPNTDQVFNSFKNTYSEEKRPIQFTIKDGTKQKTLSDVRIVGMSYEDGSGKNLIINGYCRFGEETSVGFSMYYNSSLRSGYVEL